MTRSPLLDCTYPLTFGFAFALSVLALPTSRAMAQLVPGTGRPLAQVGDDFEDPEWGYVANLPKVFNLREETQAKNHPSGRSTNDRWFEGMKRGQPDLIRRVETPAGGLPGSTGALMLRSVQTGIAGRPSYVQQQDDFIANVMYRVGKISAGRSPSVVTRVYLPKVDNWDNRTGCHFAFRLALETYPKKGRGGGLFSKKEKDFDGVYWPGMFLQFESKEGQGATGRDHDYAYLRIRATNSGGEFKGMQISQTGWWTLGMSVTPDGMVHYYAKPGIEDLTAADHITSQYPYGFRALRFRTFFYNVCSADDGRTWSTAFIVDDPTVYVR